MMPDFGVCFLSLDDHSNIDHFNSKWQTAINVKSETESVTLWFWLFPECFSECPLVSGFYNNIRFAWLHQENGNEISVVSLVLQENQDCIFRSCTPGPKHCLIMHFNINRLMLFSLCSQQTPIWVLKSDH